MVGNWVVAFQGGHTTQRTHRQGPDCAVRAGKFLKTLRGSASKLENGVGWTPQGVALAGT